MKTIAELKKEATKQNVTFAQIHPETTDFAGFDFLNNPFCTLLCKQSKNSFIVEFNCENSINLLAMNDGTYNVIVHDNYIYDVEKLNDNRIINIQKNYLNKLKTKGT